MEGINVFEGSSNKGLGSADILSIIPRGKKGDSQWIKTGESSGIRVSWGEDIGQSEFMVGIVLISFYFRSRGYDTISSIRERKRRLKDVDENCQALYQEGITVKAIELSKFIHNNDHSKRIYKAIKSLEALSIDYLSEGKETRIRLFNRVAYKRGVLAFDIANIIINRLSDTFKAFRLKPILELSRLPQLIALYVETHQTPKIKGKYFPLQEYKLMDLVMYCRLSKTMEANKFEVIRRIQAAFNEIRSKNKNFPIYRYEPIREVFESEFKKGKRWQ